MRNFVVAAFIACVAWSSRGGVTPPLQGTASALVLTAAPTLSPTRVNNKTSTPTPTVKPSAATPAVATLTAMTTITATASPTHRGTLTPSLSSTSTITPTATATATPRYALSLDPRVLSIDALRARSYGGGAIKITRVLSNGEAFQRVLVEYPSDGLRITGMMNIPRGIGPFPVVILNHGYFKPSEYKTGDGTLRAADAFARAGYLAIASDYRCYAGSQCAANPLYVGYAIDVLNLIAVLPALPYADTSRIGIWGHSMGGGIAIRVLTISDQVKVAALYGALTGDDAVHYCWLYGCRVPLVTPVPRGSPRLQQLDPDFLQGPAPPAAASSDARARLHEIFLKSSPSRHLAYVNAPVMIHHGENDDVVPIQWSMDLTDSLNALGKPASLYTYPGEGHIFAGWNWQLFMARTLAFFNDHLNVREPPVTVERRVLWREQMILEIRD